MTATLVVLIFLAFIVGSITRGALVKTRILNNLNFQRQKAHYEGDEKLRNILDNLIRRVEDA